MRTNNIHSIIIAILISFSIIFVGYMHALNNRYTEVSDGLIFDNWKGKVLLAEAYLPYIIQIRINRLVLLKLVESSAWVYSDY